MGTIDFYGTFHIKQHKTPKEKIAKTNATTQCEWALSVLSNNCSCKLFGFNICFPEAVVDLLPSPLDIPGERAEKLLCSTTRRFDSLHPETQKLKQGIT